MKLAWILGLLLPLLLVAPSWQQDDQGSRLPELAASGDLVGDQVATFDAQKEETFGEDGEQMRRVRGRNVKRRRRVRKRYRTTTQPPPEELNVAEQNVEPPYELKETYERVQVTSDAPRLPEEAPLPEEPVTTLPVEETTMRRRNKRRRRPHRKYLETPPDAQPQELDGESETPKLPRRRRKGGRRRIRPQVEPTEPNKIELSIETTVTPPELSETTAMYTAEIITEPPVTSAPKVPVPVKQLSLPVVKEAAEKEEKPTVFRYYDSRHNSISQPTVNLVMDGNDQMVFPDIQRNPEVSRFPEVQTVPEPTVFVEDSRFPQQAPESSRFPMSQFLDASHFPPMVEPRQVNTQQHPTTGLELAHFPSWSPEPSSYPEESGANYHEPKVYQQVSRSPEPTFSIRINHEPEIRMVNGKTKVYASRPTANIIKPVKEHVEESEPEPTLRHQEPADKETNEVPSEAPTQDISTQPDYGHKVFDRKALFSKSRRLPVTSAIIRKKLTPTKDQTEASPKNETTEKQLIPEGFTVQPLTMEPSKLIEKLKAHAKSYRTTTTPLPTTLITTEEPNYPKFEPKKSSTEATFKTTTDSSRFNKVVELHRSRGKVVITTSKPEVVAQTTEMEVETTETGKLISDEIVEETTIKGDDLNLEKLNDSIVELLKSESANMELAEILEARNMTLAQLLEHREKGSRHFHLGDLFSQKRSLIGENTTASMASDKEEAGTPVSVEQHTISFPSQDVLGSFPAFVSDKIQGVQQSKDGQTEVTKKPVQLENREPRVFDSMPEFKRKDPPWRAAIPNLRPVSVRGDVEEIKISHHPENPKSENDIDNVFSFEDKADGLRTNRISSSIDAEAGSPQEGGFAKFKRIPVTVKSAIIISVAILILAIFGFLSLLISCRLRQKKARLRAKQEIFCEHLKNEDFMNSQQSLSPVLNKQGRAPPPVFSQNDIHSNTASNRHYYLWRTLRKTFQYD